MIKKYNFDAGQIIDFAEETQGNDIYMAIKLVLLNSLVNLNKVQYSPEFISEIVENKEKYISIPLVAETNKLDDGKYDNLTHKQNKKTGKFGTQMIGSFIDFETNQNGDVLELIGTCRVPKRFDATCNALQELYDEGNLKFSYEIAVGEYSVKNGVKYVDKSDNNSIIAMCVVSNPAVPEAKALMLVAALESDFNDLGGEQMRNSDLTMEDMFKNAKVHFNAELDISQIQRKIYLKLREFLGDEWYNYDVKDMTMEYVIISNYYDGDYYRIDYAIKNDDVELNNKRKVTKTYVDMKEDEEEMTIAELQAKLELAESKLVEQEKLISEKDSVIAEKETVIASKDAEINDINTKVNTLSESVVLKDQEIAELQKSKDELDKINVEKAEAEKVQKREDLKNKYSKLLDQKTLEVPEIAEAIEGLNEGVLQAKVTEIALEKANEKPNENKNVVVATVTDEITLHGNDFVNKYISVGK